MSRKTATSPSPKAWVDTRQIQKIKEEPFEIKLYDVADVERLGRRRTDESEVRIVKHVSEGRGEVGSCQYLKSK